MYIVLLSHGKYNQGILDSHNMIIGESKQIYSLSLTDSVDEFSEQLNTIINQLLEKGDVLVLCDLKGGTPYNKITEKKLMNPNKIHIISGMNLPMLIEVSLKLEQNIEIEALIESAIDAGRNGISLSELVEVNEHDTLDL